MKLFLRSAWREGKLFLVVLLTYLVQTCIMSYIKILGFSPNIIFPVTAVITVCYGRMRAIWSGMIFGILMEVMQPTVTYFNLAIYPMAAVLGAVIFSDKTPKQLEYERGIGKPGRNISPWIRTPLCALMNTFVYELINLAYVYLRGADLTAAFIARAIFHMLVSAGISLLIMRPLRRFFRIKVRRDAASAKPRPYRRA